MSILKGHSKDFSESICTWYSSCSIIAVWFLTPDEHSMDLACSLTRVIFHCCLRYLSLLTLFVHVDNSYRYPKRLIWVLIKTKSFLWLDMIFSLCKAKDGTSLWRGGKSGGHPERGSRRPSPCAIYFGSGKSNIHPVPGARQTASRVAAHGSSPVMTLLLFAFLQTLKNWLGALIVLWKMEYLNPCGEPALNVLQQVCYQTLDVIYPRTH